MRISLPSVVFALCMPVMAHATPIELTQQGRLSDAAGGGLEGAATLEFALFRGATGGSAVWTESQDVVLANGYYAVSLGSETPLDGSLFTGDPLWLEVTVNSGTPLSRTRLGAVPYALNAGSGGSSGVLLGAWELDETAGLDFSDSSGAGHGLSGTASGIATGTAGHSNRGTTFVGGTLYADTGNGITDSPYITVEAWVRPTTSGSGTESMIVKQGAYALTRVDGKPQFQVTGANGACAVDHVSVIPANDWSQVSGFYNGNTIAVIVDDAVVSEPCEVGPIATSQGGRLVLGGESISPSTPYSGALDEVRLWAFAPVAKTGLRLSIGETPVCSSQNEGEITYTDGLFMGCDGSQWQMLGGDQSDETYTFTTCAKTGRIGPSQSDCNSAYSGTSLAGDVTVTAGIQYWTVPETGTYEITAWGAAGAEGTYNSGGHRVRRGGRGAMIGGRFELEAGDVVKVLVGQEGSRPAAGSYGHQPGGGGGGSFVTMQSNDILVIAGGGGGGGDPAYGQEFGGHGRIETSGETVRDHTSYVGNGGSNGNGGTANTYASGGAGYSGNGSAAGNVAAYPQSYLGGGNGGRASNHSVNSEGGFGGGGHGELCGGGGGGYSGGGAACGWSSYGRAGGGGSFNTGTHKRAIEGEKLRDGLVEIVFLH